MLASNGRDEQDFYLALLLLRMRFHAKPCMYVSLNISNAVQFADKRFLCVFVRFQQIKMFYLLMVLKAKSAKCIKNHCTWQLQGVFWHQVLVALNSESGSWENSTVYARFSVDVFAFNKTKESLHHRCLISCKKIKCYLKLWKNLTSWFNKNNINNLKIDE